MQDNVAPFKMQNADAQFNAQSTPANFDKQSATENFNKQSATARFNMIEQQIRTWDVLDPTVLQLLNDVPREHFVPSEYQGLAFADIEIPLGYEQTMLSPKLEGRILQALNVHKHQHILHIGTGSGYFTALLASLAKHVDSIEINADLSAQAAYNLTKNNISNVTLTIADGILGQPRNDTAGNQLYDAIVYTGSSHVSQQACASSLVLAAYYLWCWVMRLPCRPL